jgi:L-fuculose-phosphate aldolase
MNFDGSYKGELKPSSEWRIHKDIYENNENIKAVIHTHSSYCTALACTKRDIPAFHYMVAVAGGKDIKCAKYATFGTKELSENVIKALEDRKACLLANHGMIAVGKSLDEALKLAVEIEELAKQYYLVLQLGDTNIICDEEMDKIIEKFKTYGNLLKNK